MPDNSAVRDGKVVLMHYTLRNPNGDVIDTSDGDEPLAYLQGGQNIVPGLERALAGKSSGFRGTVVVEPSEGYGERVDMPPQSVPRTSFPPDLELEPGMQFAAQGPDDDVVPIWIAGFEGDRVLVESQHPLAGTTLHFEVEIVAVRDATSEELSHGHPHGPDGHHHH
jgi:FKBP-type peptidyl-prolyl cis-trans isomerase SlyD